MCKSCEDTFRIWDKRRKCIFSRKLLLKRFNNLIPRGRIFLSQTGLPFTPCKRLVSRSQVSNLVFFNWGCKSKFNLLWQKLLVKLGFDLRTSRSRDQSFTNTPRTRRWKQWCIDGIKRKDCMSWILISSAIRTFQTLFERLRPKT